MYIFSVYIWYCIFYYIGFGFDLNAKYTLKIGIDLESYQIYIAELDQIAEFKRKKDLSKT